MNHYVSLTIKGLLPLVPEDGGNWLYDFSWILAPLKRAEYHGVQIKIYLFDSNNNSSRSLCKCRQQLVLHNLFALKLFDLNSTVAL